MYLYMQRKQKGCHFFQSTSAQLHQRKHSQPCRCWDVSATAREAAWCAARAQGFRLVCIGRLL